MQTTGKKEYFQLIPEKIMLNISGIEESIQKTINGYCRDNLFEVISIVASQTRKNGEPAQLQLTYIKKLVPQGDKYLKELIKTGIIQRSGFPVKGQTSYKYNFAPDYLSKFVSVYLTNAKLTRRIQQAQTQNTKVVAKSIRGRKDQLFYLNRLTIAPGYDDFIKSHYIAETDKFNCIVSSATRILNGDISYKVDSTSGRFHSNVTNMPKVLRQFLRIYGEQLVNIDIKNSQPYLSTLILTDPAKVSGMTKNPAFAVLLQALKVSDKQDVKNYISLAVSGQIYEYLMREFSMEGLQLTRDETKKQVLRILYARNRMPKEGTNRKARQIFKNRFPTVHRIFSKVRGSERGDKFTSFKRFPILLQSIESYLILESILKRIYKELPGTIAITIHDSIMTGTNNVEAVRQIMIDELTNFVGFRPQTKIEGIIGEN
jgi:hypothetical protein